MSGPGLSTQWSLTLTVLGNNEFASMVVHCKEGLLRKPLGIASAGSRPWQLPAWFLSASSEVGGPYGNTFDGYAEQRSPLVLT